MRQRELDLLRGLAIILVLFRHYNIFTPLFNIGWMGVDLFFVLSGYLVSGLLFKEYLKYGSIKAMRFLIRRGFKIYPLFYLLMIITIILQILIKKPLTSYQLFSELLFVQNYFGNFYYHTWSLAVEEHFYVLLTILIFISIKFNWINSKKKVILFTIFLFIF